MTDKLAILMLALAAGFCGALSAPAPVQAETHHLPPYASVNEELSEQRRAVFVRIDRRIDEAGLLGIAREVQAREKRAYARTQVNFVLPGMPMNQGSWASVLFAPEPKVMVHGLSRTDEELFLAEHRADRRPLLGSWLTSPPAAPGRLTIYSDHGKVFAEWRLRGGQKTVDELIDTTAKAVRRFDVPGGGYYVLTRSGELEIWDKTNLIATAERIRPEHLTLPVAVALGPKVSMPNSVRAPTPAQEALPASPSQPEPKTAAAVSAASSAGAPALPQPGLPDEHAAPSNVTAPSVTSAGLDADPLQLTAKPKLKKSAKPKSRNKIAGSPKANSLSTGDVISAKIAGKF